LKLPVQTLTPGSLQTAYRREFQNLIAAEAIRRLWAKDPSLWPAGEGKNQDVNENLSWLGWLDLPDRIGAQMAHVAEFTAAAEAEGFDDVVFVAMGDSNLAAETVLHIPVEKRWKRILILDSTDPDRVRAVEKDLDLRRTLFVFANKSGKHIETHALLLYFLQRVRAQGSSSPGRHFVAVTEKGSYLAELANAYQFRETSFDPPGIKGRYSGLIHFGLLLSALCRLDPASLLSRAAAIRDVCRPSTPPKTNPALNLAAFLAAGAVEGNDRFLLFSTKTLTALMYRVAQLVGVSMGKGGHGLIPICDNARNAFEISKRGWIAAIWTMQGDDDFAVKETARCLQQADVPVALFELNGPEELGGVLFKWELATALACALLDVNPFTEPDVRDGRQKTEALLEDLVIGRGLPSKTVRVQEAGLQLYAEGATRQEISTLSLADALRTFFGLKNPEGYLAILAFVGHTPAQESTLQFLREQLASKLGLPVLLSFGPRYLHYFGQVYKGGPSKGLFLVLTGEPDEDIAIPGAGYSFGQLQLCLALGDFESLVSRKKLAVRLHLTQGAEQGLAQLQRVVNKL
jgi:transaldolase/glucose-6-phosphate isomerase